MYNPNFPFDTKAHFFFDPSGEKHATMTPTPDCGCSACKALNAQSYSEQVALHTNREVVQDAYRFMRNEARHKTNGAGDIPVNVALELVTKFALEQLRVREQHYQLRLQSVRLEHAQQLSMFMKREKILAQKAGQEEAAKHSVPDTKGRMFRELSSL